MSVFDTWEWGYCSYCQRDIVMFEGRLREHDTHTSYRSECNGSRTEPTEAPKELTPDEEAANVPAATE